MWHYHNQLLMSWFYSLVIKGMLNRIIKLTTTLKIWNTLERTYVVASHSRNARFDQPIIEKVRSLLLSFNVILQRQNVVEQLNVNMT